MNGKVAWISKEKEVSILKTKDGNTHILHKNQVKEKTWQKLKKGLAVDFELGNHPGFVEKIKIK